MRRQAAPAVRSQATLCESALRPARPEHAGPSLPRVSPRIPLATTTDEAHPLLTHPRRAGQSMRSPSIDLPPCLPSRTSATNTRPACRAPAPSLAVPCRPEERAASHAIPRCFRPVHSPRRRSQFPQAIQSQTIPDPATQLLAGPSGPCQAKHRGAATSTNSPRLELPRLPLQSWRVELNHRRSLIRGLL
jgi:hypothetical protein